MSSQNFFVPDAGYSATPTEDLHNALRESAIAMSDLTDALASRPQRRGPAPAPAGGVTKARKTAPSGRKAHPQVDANSQPVKKTVKACSNCRRNKLKCGGEQPSCGRCSGKGQLCHYGNTDYMEVVQRADAVNEWRRQEAYERAASAPRHRRLKSRALGPFRKLAPAPVVSPPHTGQGIQTQTDPVQSTADLVGLDQFTSTPYTPTAFTPSNYTLAENTPADYTPADCTAASYIPTTYIPTTYTQTSYTPTNYTPTQFTSSQLGPTQLGPGQIGQTQFDPTQFGTTLGNWDPSLQRTPQYPWMESLPDEQFHHPQESPFAQREITQLPSGPLQYGQAFDSTYGPPTVQPDWIPPYGDYENMVHPSAPIWSETGLPAQSVPWSEPVSNDFGLGSTNIAQTPAESSDHVDWERSLGYIEHGWG
ncbi:hypothetical protein BDR22DRAFT_827038 [Usnea florida]